MAPFAMKLLQPFERRQVGVGKRADRCDKVVRRNVVTLVGVDPPYVGGLVEDGTGYTRIKLNVALQFMAFGDMLQISQDFGLFGVTFRPLPFLQKLLVPCAAVDIGL